jgi:two-component system NtrC family response regulator
MIDLLIVEDDQGLQKQYRWGFDENFFSLRFADDRETAVNAINEKAPDVVLLDLGLPPDPDNASEGLEVLSQIMSKLPATKVIVVTGSEQRDHALKAVSLGAYDFFQKGEDLEVIEHAVKRASSMRILESELHNLRGKQSETNTLIIGNSDSMQKALKLLSRVAPTNVNTLLSGESGTGKELFAKTIHNMSNRKGQFVAVNCASIPGEILESELFGHEKGSFTGAHKKRMGRVEQAEGGTLFLDEVGDMPLGLQAKILRFLQEKEIQRVGGNDTLKVDVRVICATHQDLTGMSKKGGFREDLYFRLSEYTLNIPPLRDRDQDVILLAKSLLNTYRQDLFMEQQNLAAGFSHDAYCALLEHTWPGNVRELQNTIKRAMINCETALINAEDLGLPYTPEGIMPPKSWFEDGDEQKNLTLDEARREADSIAVFRAYRAAGGNITDASKILDITRHTFYAIVDKCGMRNQLKK